jgi:oligopeptide transport system substrate-binding protein
VRQPAPPNDADPYRTHRITNIQLYMALFDRLVEAWPDRTIVPSLAEAWDIAADGLRYVFRLREGLHWSDGRPLTAHDVEFGIKRVLDRERPGASAAIYYVIEGARDYLFGLHDDLSQVGVNALDDRTVEFRLTGPAPYFMYVLNRPDGAPHPAHAIRAAGDTWTRAGAQVVSGAFERTEHDSGRLLLERRLSGPMPRIGNVRRVEIAAGTLDEAIAAFERDEVDVVNTQFEYDAALARVAPDEITLDPPAYVEYLVLRHEHPALAVRDFRRALAHAIDREALAAAAPPNAIVATGGMVPPPLQGHTPDIALPFDPDLARDALRRSGVDAGIEVLTAERSFAPAIAQVAAGWSEVLGLPFPLREVGLDEFVEDSDAAAIFDMGWFPGYPDPEYFLRLLLHSDARDNHGGYASAHFDALIEQARAERDGRLRLELFHQADRFAVAEDIAAIPLLYVRNMLVVKPWVHGWWEYGKSWSSFADLVVDDGAGSDEEHRR